MLMSSIHNITESVSRKYELLTILAVKRFSSTGIVRHWGLFILQHLYQLLMQFLIDGWLVEWSREIVWIVFWLQEEYQAYESASAILNHDNSFFYYLIHRLHTFGTTHHLHIWKTTTLLNMRSDKHDCLFSIGFLFKFGRKTWTIGKKSTLIMFSLN
jgi:hypothetical protein